MKKIILSAFLLLMTFSLSAFDFPEMKRDTKVFLDGLRTQNSGDTWARLTGTVRHRRRKKDEISAPISFRTILGSKTVIAQLIFREKESYMMTQARTEPYSFSIETKGTPTLEEVGLRPTDLVMEFIYWECIGELKETVVGVHPCRVLLFKNPKAEETVRVSASSAYGIPLRVQWFKKDFKDPFRTMEVSGVKKVNDLWVVEELSVSGPGWRTTAHFSEVEAGFMKKGAPADLFQE